MKTVQSIILYAVLSACLSLTVIAQSSPDLLKRDALKHMSAGRYGEAINLLTEFITANPNEAEGYNLRGLSYEKRSQLKFALLDFRRAAKIAPDNQEVLNNLARLDIRFQDSLNKKIQKYERRISLNPRIAANYFAIGACYEDLEKWQEAETWYDKYFEVGDAMPDEVIRYSEILARHNKLKKGEQVLKNYIDRNPQEHKLHSRYGYFQLWQGKYVNATKSFELALEIKPYFKEAQEGILQSRSKGKYRPKEKKTAKKTQPQPSKPVVLTARQKIDRLSTKVRNTPAGVDDRIMLLNLLSNANRNEEALDQAEILLKKYPRAIKKRNLETEIKARQDSLFRQITSGYADQLAVDPLNKDIVLKLTRFYSRQGNYKDSYEVFENYLLLLPEGYEPDVLYSYAQQASWNGDFERAITNLDKLRAKSPKNLDYQLLSGQILVWTNKDLDQAKTFLENVYRNNPKNFNALISLSSLSVQQSDFQNAKKYLLLAKSIDPGSRDVKQAETYYKSALQTHSENAIYNILEEGRKLTVQGDCKKAIIKYDNYFSKVDKPDQAVMMEYAALHTCAKNMAKAIDIYDGLLAEEYSFDVAIQRAKNYSWNGNADKALNEFEQLYAKYPEKFDFGGMLYFGDAYYSKEEFSKAGDIYRDLLPQASDSTQLAQIKTRLSYLPIRDLSKAIYNFPQPVATTPLFNMYSDNLDFMLLQGGSGIEAGVANLFSVGTSFVNSTLRSTSDTTDMKTFKGRMYLKLSDRISASGGYGTLNIVGGERRSTMDFNIIYQKRKTYQVTFNYEDNDAALLMYSPHLVNHRLDADLYKITAFYRHPTSLTVAAKYSSISISDGNMGTDFEFTLSKELNERSTFGYKTLFSNFKFQSPFVPFSNRSQRLYYAPQKLNSHNLFFQWNVENQEVVNVDLGGSVGYIPSFDIILRSVYGEMNFMPIKYLNMRAKLEAGTSIFFDDSYNFLSGTLTAYWRLY